MPPSSSKGNANAHAPLTSSSALNARIEAPDFRQEHFLNVYDSFGVGGSLGKESHN